MIRGRQRVSIFMCLMTWARVKKATQQIKSRTYLMNVHRLVTHSALDRYMRCKFNNIPYLHLVKQTMKQTQKPSNRVEMSHSASHKPDICLILTSGRWISPVARGLRSSVLSLAQGCSTFWVKLVITNFSNGQMSPAVHGRAHKWVKLLRAMSALM